MTPAPRDWEALRRALAGDLVLPEQPEYDALRRPAIANFADARPAAIVRCAAPEDVAEALAFAARAGLPVAPRSGGHCFAGRSSTRGVVIDVAPLDAIATADGVLSAGAGARLGAIYDALAADGRAVAAGCGPTVGISGLALGGGFGVLGRRYGLLADQLVRAEVTLADGRAVVCDEAHEPDLFWALRGAGGARFGVVTALELRTVPAPELTTFHLVWPADSAVAAVDAWQAWAPDQPDELAASLLLTAFADPADPPRVNLFGTMMGGRAETAERLAAFADRVGGDPEWRDCEARTFRAAKRHLAEHGPGDEREGHLHSRSAYFRALLPRGTVAALVENLGAGRAPGETRELDLSPWGGAYTRVPVAATAFAHRDARVLIKHTVLVEPDAGAAERAAADAWLGRSWGTVDPFSTGGVYPNFPEAELDDWSPAYHGPNLERLRRVQARYDPGRVFG